MFHVWTWAFMSLASFFGNICNLEPGDYVLAIYVLAQYMFWHNIWTWRSFSNIYSYTIVIYIVDISIQTSFTDSNNSIQTSFMHNCQHLIHHWFKHFHTNLTALQTSNIVALQKSQPSLHHYITKVTASLHFHSNDSTSCQLVPYRYCITYYSTYYINQQILKQPQPWACSLLQDEQHTKHSKQTEQGHSYLKEQNYLSS
jgi:hypothetical protein